MNVALLLLSSVCMADGEAVPEVAAPPAPAPAVVASAPAVLMSAPYIGGGCGSCSSCGSGDPCGAGFAPGCQDPNPRAKREGLFTRLKNRLTRPAASTCDTGCSTCTSYAAPIHYAPVTSSCDTGCATKRVGLLSRLRARLCGKAHQECAPSCVSTTISACGTCADGCSSAYAPSLPYAPGSVVPSAPDATPIPMQQPQPPEKKDDKKTTPIGSLTPTGLIQPSNGKSPF